MVKKITVYTISSCPFSQQEKDYLKANNLPFEEKNLEQNREWLTEMLTVSNNFAGTPVTKIEDENGQITILKGFTKEEFDKVLGLIPAQPQPAVVAAQAGIKAPPPPIPPAPPIPPQPKAPYGATPPMSPDNQTSTPTPPTPPPPTSPPLSSDPSLKSVLDNLEQKSGAFAPNQPTNQSMPPTYGSQSQTPQPSTPPANLPDIPDFPK